ncbi:component of SCAR regulatory complex [Cavenderia fasciculata]|uniref:Component of SCAR regulatory complex n=1 Tax=Cavenderia fasciculata TaxID=261658 RepID=F4PQF7_CACFS|nr:component of SCAR regulatory complex [Cavenderia fasciculata]EGG22620.1 component of SCAR regulatory complex [Cavenderia fasciculata]|eukprot:XP_004360471.1 component of SCAR regulatory complex [Cavenderia fasciculata]
MSKSHIQRDWEQREFNEEISLNIQKIIDFLNKFDLSTRNKLATVNEKLSMLERQVDYLESAIKTVNE